MTKNILYIIGNGFDLHHGMRTSYYDFAAYLEKVDSHLHGLLEEYIDLMSEDDLWARFEENLANLDVEEILSDHTDRLPDYMSDDFRDRDRHVFPDIMDDMLKALTSTLFQRFKTFIQAVEIPPSAEEKMLKMDQKGLFFTFNYTPTLEELYHIDSANILYIHNKASSYYTDLILGHGINPEDLKPEEKTPPEGLNDEEQMEWYEQNDDYEYSYDTGKDTIYQYFSRSFKPSEKIIEDNSEYFSALTEISSIHVLGHSLSEVDLPYIRKIKESVDPDAIWHVSFYGAAEKRSRLSTLLSIGLKEENIRLFELREIQIANAQLELDL